jgi:hypothetical protein
MLNEPFDCALERALLPSLDLRICQVTTNSETMGATFEIFSLVSWSELATAKYLVGFGLSFEREHLIHCASVKQERSFRVRQVFLTVQTAIRRHSGEERLFCVPLNRPEFRAVMGEWLRTQRQHF